MKKILIFAIAFVLSAGVYAQQDPMFTHYMFNTLAINPGYAGTRDALTVTGLHRSQWVNFEGAPITQTVTMHTPFLSKKTGLGISFLNDKIGPTNTTSFYVDFSYKIKVTKKASLSFGLKGGTNMMRSDLSTLDIQDEGDVAFASDLQSQFLPNFGAGLYYSTDKYYVGLSVPKLLENNFDNNTATGSTDLGGEEKHYFLIAGTYFNLSQDIKLKPTTFLKVTNGAPMEMDVTGTFIYKDKVWAGLMYRTGDAAGGLFGVNLTSQLALGYSFDWSMANTTFNYNGGSHEVMLRYDFVFGNEKKIRSPRYF